MTCWGDLFKSKMLSRLFLLTVGEKILWGKVNMKSEYLRETGTSLLQSQIS